LKIFFLSGGKGCSTIWSN